MNLRGKRPNSPRKKKSEAIHFGGGKKKKEPCLKRDARSPSVGERLQRNFRHEEK